MNSFRLSSDEYLKKRTFSAPEAVYLQVSDPGGPGDEEGRSGP
ncbi:MAG: hypothetical protein R6U39_08820 [Candidatus Aegiribacteria sp.]